MGRVRIPLALRCFTMFWLAASGPIGAQALPGLIAIDTAGSDTAEFGLPAAPLQAPVTQLRFRFDSPLTAVSASSFRVLAAGADGIPTTLLCTGLPAGDDIDIGIASLHWHEALHEATLQLDAPRGLPRGRYRVLACDTLLGLGGVALDGDADHLPGGNAVREFQVHETPILSNPGFDVTSEPWLTYASPAGAAESQRTAIDADAAPASGALRVVSSGASALVYSTECLDMRLVGALRSAWNLRLRYRVVTGNVNIIATVATGFAGDMGDTPCVGPSIVDQVSFRAVAAPAFATFDSGWRDLDILPNGAMSLRISPRTNEPFEVLFDDLGLRFDSRLIFRDDFD